MWNDQYTLQGNIYSKSERERDTEKETERVAEISIATCKPRFLFLAFMTCSLIRWKSCFHHSSLPRIVSEHKKAPDPKPVQIGRREVILRSSELAVIASIFHFSGAKPNYLGVQKNPPSLALCPATKNCISTSEETSDLTHYAPPWNYNGRGRKKPVSKEEAMAELLEVIKSTKPDKFTPRIIEKKDDYIRVEYESPIMGFVDDVEFWFPPGKKSTVEYRSASRLGNYDFDVNRKRIKALRLELEKKGWASEGSF